MSETNTEAAEEYATLRRLARVEHRDAAFIAAANPAAVLALLDERDELAERVEALEDGCGRERCDQCGPGYWIGDDGCRHTGMRARAERAEAALARVRRAVEEDLPELCGHEPDEHPEGCCEVCDLAFATSVTVLAALDGDTEAEAGESE